jgi:hypothetical protein
VLSIQIPFLDNIYGPNEAAYFYELYLPSKYLSLIPLGESSPAKVIFPNLATSSIIGALAPCLTISKTYFNGY